MKTKIIIETIFILCFFSFIANAAVPISGRIIEESSKTPLEYANIILLSLPDSVYVNGMVSNETGVFKFDNVISGKYLLKISYIGLENNLISVDVSTMPVDLGDIPLKESNVLKEVVVTSKIPPFQSGVNGGIVANVSTTLLSSVGTANDVLQRIPGIISDNGKITVFGKGAPIVYINNRKVQDNQELERLESSEISTVELITNPGAKYDAEGRAVLLIKTKTKISGFSAQVTERIQQGNYLGDNENVSISYTKDKLNLFASYYRNYYKRNITENHYFTLNNPDSIWQYNTFSPDYWYSNNPQQVNAGFDFSINDKHAIGGQYQYYNNDYKDAMPINTITYLNGMQHKTSQSQSHSTENIYRHLINAFYNGDFSEHFSMRFDFDYLKNHDDKQQYLEETINSLEKDTVEVFNKTNYDLYAGKLTNSYKSNIGLIEFGGEYNYISGNGFVRSNGYTDNSEFTNTEQKAAGFVSYSHTFGNINVSAGLRYEFTKEQYTQDSTKTVIIDRKYSDLYPNVSISKKIKNVDLSLVFNKRTQRPSFSQLNGNVIYVNRFVFQKGNPYLNKSNIYEVNLQATLKPFYFNAGYYYYKNPVLLYFEEQGNDANILLTTANLQKIQELNATLNFNHKIAFWQPNYTAEIAKPFFSAMYNDKETTYNKINYFFNAYNDFTLPGGFVLSCNFRYQSDRQDAFIESKSYQSFDAGVRKSFFNNALRLNLMVYDIFNWVKVDNYQQINNINWTVHKKRETRYATLSITYLFNNYKKKYRGQSAAQDDINRF